MLHISILIAGWTGVFGRLISLSEGMLVWYRVFLASLLIWPVMLLSGKMQRLKARKIFQICCTGAILALHWVLFYGSIKASNVSIGVVCFASVGFFTAICEPLILRSRFSWSELACSMLTLLGIFLIFSLDVRYRTGILIGVLSAFVCAIYTILNKKVTADVPTTSVLPYQFLGGFIGMTLVLPFYLQLFPTNSLIPTKLDFIYLLIYVIVCTFGLYFFQIKALKKISAFTVNLSYNLEPVYSIIIAMILFNESRELNFSFWIGITLIIISVALQSWRAYRKY